MNASNSYRHDTGFVPQVVETEHRDSHETPDVPKSSYDLRILQSLRRVIRAVDLHSRKLAMQYNITGPQLACLTAMAELGPMTASALARSVYLSPSTIVGILDRLEQKGLAERHRSEKDRRVVQVSLTASGYDLVNENPSSLQENLANGLNGLPELEQVSITMALERIVELMEAGNIDASPVLETGALVRNETAKDNF